ncbi:thioesterase domain-containing protein [Bradyrhizobium sp. F1.4.3]|uniref:thioesterase domain-containing protein n=1 Tax=Bradyrhizobium sp. F1.4.3 TaxID=3156356 RepID=UPI00339B97B7
MATDCFFLSAEAKRYSHVVQLRGEGTGPSLVCFPGSGGNVHIFREMAAALPEGHPVYGIDLGWLCDQTKDFTIERLAALYTDVVKSLDKSGSYLLCGYSFGGLLAYELAARLVEEGHDVRAVLLLDAPNPSLLANLSPSETTQYRKRYLVDRLKRYRDHLLQGDVKAFASRGLAFIVSRASKPLLPLLKLAVRLTGTTLPTIIRSNDPGFLRAWNAYKPTTYPKNVVCFRVEDRGAEHQNDPSMGWSNCALGGVEVHVVPGGHVDMMAMPSVKAIADVAATYLRDNGTGRQRPAAARS